MIDAHNHGSGEYWNKYDNKVANQHGIGSKSNTFGLVFLLVILMGMGFYIGSFYWDRDPVPEITRKHQPSESHSNDRPVTHDKNLG